MLNFCRLGANYVRADGKCGETRNGLFNLTVKSTDLTARTGLRSAYADINVS